MLLHSETVLLARYSPRISNNNQKVFIYTYTPIFCHKLYTETLWFLPCCHIVVLYGKTLLRKTYLSNRLSHQCLSVPNIFLPSCSLFSWVGKLLRNSCKFVHLYTNRIISTSNFLIRRHTIIAHWTLEISSWIWFSLSMHQQPCWQAHPNCSSLISVLALYAAVTSEGRPHMVIWSAQLMR